MEGQNTMDNRSIDANTPNSQHKPRPDFKPIPNEQEPTVRSAQQKNIDEMRKTIDTLTKDVEEYQSIVEDLINQRDRLDNLLYRADLEKTAMQKALVNLGEERNAEREKHEVQLSKYKSILENDVYQIERLMAKLKEFMTLNETLTQNITTLERKFKKEKQDLINNLEKLELDSRTWIQELEVTLQMLQAKILGRHSTTDNKKDSSPNPNTFKETVESNFENMFNNALKQTAKHGTTRVYCSGSFSGPEDWTWKELDPILVVDDTQLDRKVTEGLQRELAKNSTGNDNDSTTYSTTSYSIRYNPRIRTKQDIRVKRTRSTI